jgi:hypothetical protein
MPKTLDFERAWLARFSKCLDEVASEEIRQAVMQGSEELSMASSRQEVIDWSKAAMKRLEALTGTERSQQIMTGCACQYPKADLQDIKQQYEATGDIDRAHQLLQKKFEAFLRDTLELCEDLVSEIAEQGWGLAGVKQGNRIIATKIPKSGHLVAYMAETDPEKKRRQFYCHCPRVREILKSSETISPTYCYCGAGFYKGIWEEILQKPVEVEVLESVLQGDEVCKIAITLPAG